MSIYYHTFCGNVAEKTGVEKAIILQNIYFWNEKNFANGKLENGLPFTYNSGQAFEELFPYLNRQKIARLLRELEADGYIVTGCFNQNKYDHTKWYCVTDLFLEIIGESGKWNVKKETPDCQKNNDRLLKNEQSSVENLTTNVTDITTDITADNNNIYNPDAEISKKIKNNEYAFQVFEKLQKNKILCSKDFTQFIMRDWRIALPIIHQHGLHSDDVLQAIENYGEILSMRNKTWWNVKQPFHTWCEKNILRFIPSIFSKDDFLVKNKKEFASDVDRLTRQKKIKLEYTK